jgi:EAL domain-containing protein (putative c-di-GMP-specific phosphodiesterase class I)
VEGADAASPHDTIFQEAGQRGMARELFIGLVEYACQDARDDPRKRDTYYMIRAPLPLIADEQLQVELERAVEAAALDRARICFEIPEMSFLEPWSQAGLRRVKEQGFQLSLASFGSGVAPFEALYLGLSFLQVSRGYVRTVLHDTFARELVRTTNELAHLGAMRSIADGVDNVEQVYFLRALGVDYAEGPAIGRPA